MKIIYIKYFPYTQHLITGNFIYFIKIIIKISISIVIYNIFYIFAAKKKSKPIKSPTGVAGKDCNSLNRNIEQRKIVVSN